MMQSYLMFASYIGKLSVSGDAACATGLQYSERTRPPLQCRKVFLRTLCQVFFMYL